MTNSTDAPEWVPIIMAGGSGTRLWPVSRRYYPKQFQPIHPQGQTPFQQAIDLASLLPQPTALKVVVGTEHRFLAQEQLKSKSMPDHRIEVWTEPLGRNTASVAALGCCLAARPEDIVLLLPADHCISDSKRALQAFSVGRELAQRGDLVVFGVQPEQPEENFGYIELEPEAKEAAGLDLKWWSVRNFHEKPQADKALAFYRAGNYYWNSGIYMARADVLAQQLQSFAPDILDQVRQAHAATHLEYGFYQLPQESWSQLASDSFDYAVAEHSRILSAVEFDAGWTDLGSFETLWKSSKKDASNNAISGDVLPLDSRNNLLLASANRLLATMDVEDMVVVDSGDAVLVAPRGSNKKMRELVAQVAELKGRDLLDNHLRVYRPWGSYLQIDSGDNYLCKRIQVNPGAALSLQRHRHRSEHWIVVRGQAEVVLEEEVRTVKANESVYIPKGAVHSLRNPGSEVLEVVEVQTGSILSENDIERLEDHYGRAK
ncbi:MAG: mannose-1-phosphate guanylyltransferase/mannose-6-phosphate isomerase [Gammaproteobacteria bacterium]